MEHAKRLGVRTETFALVFREVPKSVNAGGGGVRAHHFVAYREKSRWQGLFLAEMMAGRVRRGMQFVTVDVTIRWKHRNHRDLENYRHPVVKPLADALIRGGYLADDTDEFFRVRDFEFHYPTDWPHRDPRLKAEMVVKLEAQYE